MVGVTTGEQTRANGPWQSVGWTEYVPKLSISTLGTDLPNVFNSAFVRIEMKDTRTLPGGLCTGASRLEAWSVP